MSFPLDFKNKLPPSWRLGLSRAKRTFLKLKIKTLIRNDLNRLALWFATDKWGRHWYTQHYQRYFSPIRNQNLNVLEIGVGGYANAEEGAESLRMWKAYFRKSKIVGIDIHDKTRYREHRIDIRQCDQTDENALRQLSAEYNGFDIIIDDGSHISEHVIATFKILFPLLHPNGIYTIEDTQTSYWPTWGGGVNDPKSLLNFFKSLTDGLNYVEYPVKDYTPNYFDQNIVEMAFFHNLIIIRKGSNDEKANAPEQIENELAVAEATAAKSIST